MGKTRLEAFSDGVIAIIITIMVLELKVPHEPSLDGAAAAVPRVPELRAELRLRRHLLEQPPSHAARVTRGHRRHPVGQPAPAVLAVAGSVRHRLDGREPLRAAADRALRRRAADGGDRLLDAAAADHRVAGAGLDCCSKAVGGDWKGKLSPLLYIVAILVAPWRRGWPAHLRGRRR